MRKIVAGLHMSLGGGKRLFDEKDGRVPLKLTGSQTFPTGVVHLTYQPV